MPSSSDAPGERLLVLWRRLHRQPGGSWLFHRMLARMVPYTGALGARLVQLEPGRAVVVLHDRRGVRNHLRSIHAVALANLCELASGTAMLTALPAGTRGIVTHLEISFLKKARGTVTARSEVRIPPVTEPTEMYPEAEVVDAAGDVVARARVTWKVQPAAAPSAAPSPMAGSGAR
jgi:uncharacterized protein (TIGR00369 family)